jgi:RNA polymerase sigma factor (sigma-70 family)
MATMSEHRTAVSRQLGGLFGAGALGCLDDGELLRRYLAGRGDDDSAAAFAALVERHGPMVLGVCRRALGNLHDAEDAAQATFLILARRAGAIRRAGSLASWLFGVARKVAARARTRSDRTRAIEREVAEMRAVAAGSEMLSEDRWELYEELERLPERYRAPIVLCHLEGLSNEQAAARLAIPVRTVQRRLSVGRERLRHRLARLGLAPASGPAVEAASESWIEATVRAATGLASGQTVGAVAPASVAALVDGAMAGMLVARAKAVVAGIIFAGVVIAVGGVGALLAARQQADPRAPQAKSEGSKAPPVAQLGPLIKGIVVDEMGRPVAGARVSPEWAVPPRSATSGADGTFVLAGNEPWVADHSLLATVDGGARQGIVRLDGPSGYRGPRTLVRIVVRPAWEMKTTVVDGRGAPVPDAAVVALDKYFAIAEARTDARGTAVLRVPADAKVRWIIAAKPGVGFDYFENDRGGWVTPWPRLPRNARLVVDGARTVRVRAVDSAGRPVPGVEMEISMIQKKGKFGAVHFGGFPLRPVTDANGVATFDWLPAGLMGRTSVSSASRAYFDPDLPSLDADKPDAEIRVPILRLTRISGRVTRPDGSPAPGVLVDAHGWGGRRWSLMPDSVRARTTEDGSYAMDLRPEQSYMIGVTDDEWAAKSLVSVAAREGVARTGLDLSLERGAIIRGRVTTEPGSQPAPGRSVKLVEKGPAIPPKLLPVPYAGMEDELPRFAVTDEDGRYAFRVAPGTHVLNGPVALWEQPRQEELKIAAGEEIERNFSIPGEEPPWKTVRGVVRAGDASGPPVAGAVLVVAPAKGREASARGDADERGRFELPCPAGKAIVYARNPEGTLAGYVVIDGKDAPQVTIVARPAATARGRVVDEDGKPWASVNIRYSVEVGLPAVGVSLPPGADQVILTDDDGRFTATGLPVGTKCYVYAYYATASNHPSRRIEVKDTRPFEVPPLVMDRPGHLPDRPKSR